MTGKNVGRHEHLEQTGAIGRNLDGIVPHRHFAVISRLRPCDPKRASAVRMSRRSTPGEVRNGTTTLRSRCRSGTRPSVARVPRRRPACSAARPDRSVGRARRRAVDGRTGRRAVKPRRSQNGCSGDSDFDVVQMKRDRFEWFAVRRREARHSLAVTGERIERAVFIDIEPATPSNAVPPDFGVDRPPHLAVESDAAERADCGQAGRTSPASRRRESPAPARACPPARAGWHTTARNLPLAFRRTIRFRCWSNPKKSRAPASTWPGASQPT